MASANTALAQNLAIRQNILANAVPVFQNVRSGSTTWTSGSPTTVTVLGSNVGLIRRWWLEISGTFNAASGKTLTPSMLGMANLLSNVTFIDQNNRVRINTTGAHLHLAATQKRKRPFGSAIYGNSTPVMSDPTGIGFNFPVQNSTGVVTGTTAKNFTFVYEIPVVNSNMDLTGAIYANQTTSNNQLQFTFNPNMVAATGTDAFNAVYLASDTLTNTAPTLTNLKWTLYQDFLDQLPVDNTGFAQLPPIDIAYALCYQMISPGSIVAGQDNLYALPPFNIYQDIMAFWDNYSYATSVGGDVSYLKVQIANTYILLQQDPLVNAIKTRNLIGSDFPAAAAATNTSGAVYDLDFRHKPLTVNQLSSTNIVFNPSTVESGASLQYGQEYIWYANQAAA